MSVSPAVFAWPDWCVLLPSCLVDTNESLRQRALRLVTRGVSQKVLAGKMGMTPSTFSRWLNQKDGINPASVTALDGFNAYVHELADALAERSPVGFPERRVEERRHTTHSYKGKNKRSGKDRRRVADE